MNLPFYIAKTVARGGGRSVSRNIIIIATIAVAVSMATMVVSSALISGFKSEISTKIFGFWGHIHVTDDAASYGIYDTYNYPISNQQDYYPGLDTTGRVGVTSFTPDGKAELVTTRGGIQHIQQFIVLPGVVSVYQEGQRLPVQEPLALKGIAEDYDWDGFGQYLIEGEALRVSPDSLSRGIIISNITAKRLQLKLGDRMDFAFIGKMGEERPRVFTVRGIYKTGLEEFDSQFALVDIKQPRGLLSWEDDQIGGFEIMLDDLEDLDLFQDYIHYDVLTQDQYAETIRTKFSELFGWLDIQDYTFVLILLLMVIVAIINMVTALLILILERTNMIGTLKALGQSNWSIRQIFLYYAAFIIIGGVLLGNALGLGLCWLQKTFGLIRLDEESYYLAVAPIQINWGMVLALNVGTLVITLLFLTIPSFLVTRVDPVKAIRFR